MALLFIGANTEVSAQAKFGHIDTQLLISLMPETKKAESELQTLASQMDQEFQKMGQELQGKMQKYQAEAATVSDAINQTRAKEVQDMQQRMQEYNNTATQDLQKKRFDLFQPILEKAQKAIDEVAQEKGLTYVFDLSKGAIIYQDSSLDILTSVKGKLNIQ